MKILLVSWHFPPINAIASVRLGKLARYLDLAGHDVSVVTVANPHKDRSLPVEIDPLRVHRTRFVDVDAYVNPVSWYQRLRARVLRASKGPASEERPVRASAQSRLSKLYRELVFVPDRYVGWAIPLFLELRRRGRSGAPDVILVSGPPFSAFLAVALYATRAGIPWVAEFRDRWANDPYALIPSWRRTIDCWLESRIIRLANGLVTVSEPWSQHYARVYRLPVVTVMNGFDPNDFAHLPSGCSAQPLPLRLVYTGFVYPERRDPTALFRALLTSGIGPDEVRVLFYGSRSIYLEACIDKMGVRPYVEIHDPVPYGEAIRLQAAADILLLLQWNNPADESNVPGKVFEYLAVRRPILGLGPENGIPARLIRERGAGLYSNDPTVLAEQLRLWVAEKRVCGHIRGLPADVSSGLCRDAQYAKLDGFLGQIANEGFGQRGSQPSSLGLQRTLHSPLFSLADTSVLARPVLCAIIDTEADFDWTGPFAREGHDVGSIHALRHVQALFERFNLRPTYLVDYPIAADPIASRILRDLLNQGLCDIGVQLHTWTTPPFDELLCERNSYGSNLPAALQRRKLECLLEAAARAFAIKPKVFKAGRYGFGDTSADLLEECGFLVDTSVLPFTDLTDVHGPAFYGVPDRPFWFGRSKLLLELPVTRNFTGLLRASAPGRLYRVIDSRLGQRARLPGVFARLGLLDRLTLTPEGMTLADMCTLTKAMIAGGRKVFTLSFHSPSLAPGNTPYVRSAADLQGFVQRLSRFLEFFFDQLGGRPMTALEVYSILSTRRQTPFGPDAPTVNNKCLS